MFHDVLLEGTIKNINSIIFNEIDAKLIARNALRKKGVAGSSGLNSDQWRRILGTRLFGSSGLFGLCKAIARMAVQLCTTIMDDPNSIFSLLAYRLIPLNINQGVRPIGIAEVIRRIIGKLVRIILKSEVQSAAGYIQLCAGQEAGCETAVPAAHDILFITGGKELTYSEGTTLGDPISMAIYAIWIIPLMTMATGSMSACIKQIAFADDLTGI